MRAISRCGVAVRFAAKAAPQAELRRLYEEERWPVARIAAYFGVSVSTITNARRRYGMGVRVGRRPTQGDSGRE